MHFNTTSDLRCPAYRMELQCEQYRGHLGSHSHYESEIGRVLSWDDMTRPPPAPAAPDAYTLTQAEDALLFCRAWRTRSEFDAALGAFRGALKGDE